MLMYSERWKGVSFVLACVMWKMVSSSQAFIILLTKLGLRWDDLQHLGHL